MRKKVRNDIPPHRCTKGVRRDDIGPPPANFQKKLVNKNAIKPQMVYPLEILIKKALTPPPPPGFKKFQFPPPPKYFSFYL
jgi:hypothetical protein